jgi:hypothetical protein
MERKDRRREKMKKEVKERESKTKSEGKKLGPNHPGPHGVSFDWQLKPGKRRRWFEAQGVAKEMFCIQPTVGDPYTALLGTTHFWHPSTQKQLILYAWK